MADGRPFAFLPLDFDIFAVDSLALEAAELPIAAKGVFMASTNPLPLGVRADQTLIVDASAVVGDNYNAAPGSAIEVHAGGTIGHNMEAVGALVNIMGGSVGHSFDAASGAVIHISGGTVGIGFDAFAGSTVLISGGSVGTTFEAFRGSTVNISGGSIDISSSAHSGSEVNIAGGKVGNDFDAQNGSLVNFSGGAIGNDFDAESGSTVNIFGTQFTLAGSDITEALTENVPYTVTNRNVVLAGSLADGTAFDFQLNSSSSIFNNDFFSSGATLTITLVSGIPGDYNDDGIVNNLDLLVWEGSLGTTVDFPGAGADGNFDGKVTQADFYVWKLRAVPEPATAPLALFASTILLARNRRRWP
jgi:hypothetical protein